MTGNIFLERSELSVSETDGSVLIPIVRTGDLSGAVTIQYGITADTAQQGLDYSGASGSITMAPGQSRILVPVSILNDTLSEPTETFVLSIITVDSGTLTFPRTSRISILDDENPVPGPTEPPLSSNYVVTEQDVATGLTAPVSFEFSPVNPSLVYVSEHGGKIKVYNVDTGAQVSTFIDLTSKVNENNDRGLIDIAIHPDFENNPYIYAYYVADPPDAAGETGNAGLDGGGNRYAHVVRFTADASTGYTTVVPGSEVILVGGGGQSLADISGNGAIDSTNNFSIAASDIADNSDPNNPVYKEDYIKVDSRSHMGGSLVFGPDGALYISTGDGTSYNATDPRSVSVQSVDSLAGKILRVDPLTGEGLADNPFVNPGDDLSSNQAKVFALGLRHPFSTGFDTDGRLIITETGWNSYEEINVVATPGANFGWPFYEGGDNGVSVKTPGYQNLPQAAAFYAAVESGEIQITAPFRAFSHDSSAPGYQVQAITGGDNVYTGSVYPSEFLGDYFFTDFVEGEIYTVDIHDRRDVKYLYSSPSGFGPSHFSQGPDGYVYYANYVAGTFGRLLIEPKQQNAAINAGGAAFTATTGAYVADQFFTGGGTYKTTAAIAGTTDDALYQTERYGDFSYAIPVTSGTYNVTLQFAEIYWDAAGKRVFDVSAEGALRINDLDIFKAAGGKNIAYDVTIQVGVTDGTLNLAFDSEIDFAKLSALKVTPASGSNIPPAANDDSAIATVAVATTINVLANDSDPNGDLLAIASFTQGGKGSVTLDTRGTASTSDDVLVYTSNAGASGTDAFTYTVSDGKGGTDTATVTVNLQAPGSSSAAINAGGPAFTATTGAYAADQFFTGGGTFQTSAAIAGTTNDALYQTERYGNFSYAIPLANGTYNVTLQFAEIYWDAAGQRVFDVSAEGALRIDDLDIFAAAGGKNIAYDVIIPVSVTDGTLNLNFTSEIDLAKLSALKVTPTSGSNISPIATDDSTIATVAVATTINVLANDSDPNGDLLAIASFTQGGKGSVTLDTRGTASTSDDALVYTSNAGASGTDAFTYTVSDGKGGTDTATVTVNLQAPGSSSAINAGGPAFTATTGAYAADQFFIGGGTHRSNAAIAGTTDDALYRTERYGDFSYAIPVANGTYNVTLQFAEIYWDAAGQRVFDVSAEGALRIDDLDIFAAAGGKNIAYDVTIPVSVTDGALNLAFDSEVDFAKLSALRITPSDAII